MKNWFIGGINCYSTPNSTPSISIEQMKQAFLEGLEKIRVCSVCRGFYKYPLIREYPKDKEMKRWVWECNECVLVRIATLNKGILDMKGGSQC